MTFLEQVGKAVVDWAKFKPKDEYTVRTLSSSDLSSGFTPNKTCIATAFQETTQSNYSGYWYIEDTTQNKLAVALACPPQTTQSASFIALKGHTYRSRNASGTANRYLIVYEPTAMGGVCSKAISTRRCA